LLCTLLAMSPAAAQQRTVTGRVTDRATGQPLLGAEISVSVGGTVAVAGRTGASAGSNTEGTVTSQVENSAVNLVARMPGYRQAEVSVAADQQTVQIQLDTDPLNLDEIVVTGQATGVQRRNLANAVSTVSAEDLNIVPTASIETQLAG